MAWLTQVRRPAVAGLLIAALVAVLVAHVGVLDNSFQYDDFHSVVDNPHIRSLDGLGARLADPRSFSARPERAMFRPLVVLSHALNHHVGGAGPEGFLLANLVAHLGCAALVGVLGVVLGLGVVPAAIAGLLFVVHSVNAEVANYVSSRSESLATAGALGALIAYIRWRRGDAGTAVYVVGLLALGAALLSKATAVAVPVMLASYEAFAGGHRRRWLPVVPFAGLAAGYVWLVADLAGTALGAPVRPLTVQLWTQIKAFTYYLHMLVLPVHLTVEHAFEPSLSPLAVTTLMGAALALSAAVVAWRHLVPRERMLSTWALLSLAPASLVPLNVLVNEHRLYAVSACLALGLASWADRRGWLRAPGGVTVLGGGLLLAGLVVLSQQRSRVWDTQLSLWSEAVARAPGAYRAQLHLGGALEADGEHRRALAHFQEAAQLAPDRAETHYNLGNAWRLNGDPEAARMAWERCLAVQPGFFDALVNLAAYHQDRGALGLAGEYLDRAAQVMPHSAEVWRRRGVLARKMADPTMAERAYRSALELEPEHAETHYNLANLLYDKQLHEEAEREYRIALGLEPAHHAAANNLALLLVTKGEAGAAAALCRDALRLSPGQSKLYYLLGRAQETQGKLREAAASYQAYLRAGTGPEARLADARRRLAALTSMGSG